MAGFNYMTQEGYEKIISELNELKTNGRQAAAQAIAEAREKGDLSENAEYDAAKDAQGMLEMKINDLEIILSSARVIDESELDNSKVTILTKVKIRNTKNKMEVSYKLVSEKEADIKAKKISVNSPIAKGLLGKKVGDSAQIVTPAGTMNFEIIDISF